MGLNLDGPGYVEIGADVPDESAIDLNVTIEVYEPLFDDNPVRQDPDDVDDRLFTAPYTLEMLAEAV